MAVVSALTRHPRSLLLRALVVMAGWITVAVLTIAPVPLSASTIGYVVLVVIAAMFVTVGWLSYKALRAERARVAGVFAGLTAIVTLVVGLLCVAAVTRTLAAFGVLS